MKKLTFTFKYSLPPGLRKKKIQNKENILTYPLIPVRFYSKTVKTTVIEALLDSGSDMVHTNRSIVSFLNLPKGKKIESAGMGGKYMTYKTKVGLILGRGGREVDFGYVNAVFPEEEKDVPVLIGRIPVFEEFQIIFEEDKKKFKLIPKEEFLEKKKKNSKK
ncbi:hypothetical protein LCGC14_0806200 [marine sediment metagenome]|uniref:Peptidase A2 domain-containing protein n=1 Tax=marine sediment metagenome TaxID=412755 RepID=A0A0F9PN37_9ZZZZ